MKRSGKKWALVEKGFREGSECLFWDETRNGLNVRLIGPIPSDWCFDADPKEDPPVADFDLAESIIYWLEDYDGMESLGPLQHQDIADRKAAFDKTVARISEKFAAVLAMPIDTDKAA